MIPLSTFTHELDGGAGWPAVGDRERVTSDLMNLVRGGDRDALGLGLPELPRALICTGPQGHVRALDAASGEAVVYGAAERAAVLAEIDKFLARLVRERDLWPGEGLPDPGASTR